MGDEGGKLLAKALAQNSSVRSLDFSGEAARFLLFLILLAHPGCHTGNSLTKQGTAVLLKAVRDQGKISHLSLAGGIVDSQSLGAFLANLTVITDVNLSCKGPAP